MTPSAPVPHGPEARHEDRAPPFRRRTRPGAIPGSVVADPAAPKPRIHVTSWDNDDVFERNVARPADLKEIVVPGRTAWIDVAGLGDSETILELGRIFELHPLALEDVVHVHQRAKVEEYPERLFVVARMVFFEERMRTEQIAMFLGPGFVITFRERSGDCLDPVRERIRTLRGRFARLGADYLLYSLLDAVIDGWFPALESIGLRLDVLEDRIAQGTSRRTVQIIHRLRSDLLELRKVAWQHREAIALLIRDEHALVGEETRIHLRDCADHTVQIADVVETYREMCTDLRDLHFSQIDLRTNEIMKVLTVIATIFMPMNFVAAVYGMNFDGTASPWNMPELRWRFGYPFAWAVMGTVAASLLLWFRSKGWLKRKRNDR